MTQVVQQSARQALKQAGLQYTRQRLRVLEILMRSTAHLDAYDIFSEVGRGGEAMSLSTVYRILQVFREHKLVAENHLGEDHHHYETLPGPQDFHHHAVCDRCGAVFEFSLSAEEFTRQNPELSGFRAKTLDLSVRGICRACGDAEVNSGA